MFGWRYCHYTSFVCMSWKTTCHDTHMQPIMKNYKHAWISLCHENMSATGHEKKHMACSMQVMNQISCNTCHETMIMKTHVMTWSCMETHHEQHMSWTPHEFQVLWFYHGIASAHNAKKPTQPQVPVLVLTQKAAKSFWAHMQKLQICFPVLCSTVAMSSVASFACGIWTLTSWSGQSKFHPSMCWSKAGSGSFHTHISSVLTNETLVAHWRANMCRNLCTSQPSGGSTSGKMLPQSGLVE